MGALPKNKITRAERGKRRAGNTPTITKDTSTNSVPLHKQGLVASILSAAGLTPAVKSDNKKSKKSEKAAHAHPQDGREVNKAAARPQNQAPVQPTRKTQHKG